MWSYQKNLQYPIKVKNPNPRLASYIVSQYGGPECQTMFLVCPQTIDT